MSYQPLCQTITKTLSCYSEICWLFSLPCCQCPIQSDGRCLLLCHRPPARFPDGLFLRPSWSPFQPHNEWLLLLHQCKPLGLPAEGHLCNQRPLAKSPKSQTHLAFRELLSSPTPRSSLSMLMASIQAN